MSERIDHAKKALRNIDGLHDYQSEEGMSDESMLTVAIEAQVHATLALVEQQRIANLIALWGMDNAAKGVWISEAGLNPDASDASARLIAEALGLT